MRMVIRYRSGLRAQGVFLAAGRDCMRVAVESQRDTVEFNCVHGAYYAENGETVEIEAMMPIPDIQFPAFCTQVYPLTSVAGGQFIGV